ncbi:terminase small subunit protein [Agrobacterium pusense]|uniref:terminase small subunit-like protein n=1 Tax=Agrobacterium pusense TaxID=648995 RepID=UPI003B52A34F
MARASSGGSFAIDNLFLPCIIVCSRTANASRNIYTRASKPVTGVTTYTEEIGDAICERIALGESVRSICDDEAMPSMSTVFKWLRDNEAFSQQYARAREVQADALFDDIIDIADDGRNDWMEKRNADGESIGWQENGEALRRSQLRIDARKWMAGKLRPKKYGEKLALTDGDGGPLKVEVIKFGE